MNESRVKQQKGMLFVKWILVDLPFLVSYHRGVETEAAEEKEQVKRM